MHQDWRIYAKNADFKALSEKYGIDPVVARVIRNRDVVTDTDFENYIPLRMERTSVLWATMMWTESCLLISCTMG